MSKKDDGFTRLPNALIDSQIMAELNDKAFKCLMLIIRQTLGFDRDSHIISITQFQKFCGIKKRDTVIASIQSLEEAKVITVQRKLGRLNSYSLTLNQYQQTGLVLAKGTSPMKQDKTSPIDSDGTSTSKRDTNKENLKENLNKEKNIVPVDKSKSEMFGDSVKYHDDDKNLYSLRELSKVYPVQSDLVDQIVERCPDFTNEQIMSELKNFAQWSTGREKTTAQGWMNYWIYRIQKISAPNKAKSQKPAKAKSKGLSDAQIDYFASKLTAFHEFAAMYANVGETQKSFTARVASKLRDPEQLKQWASYLKDVGFTGQIEDFT